MAAQQETDDETSEREKGKERGRANDLRRVEGQGRVAKVQKRKPSAEGAFTLTLPASSQSKVTAVPP